MPDQELETRQLNRVRWLCRRGMKELDIVMNRYRENNYDTRSTEDKQHFREFLGLDDPDIFSWIMGRGQPENPHYATIIKQLQNMFDKPIGS